FVGGFLVAEVGVHHARPAAPDLADLVVLARLAVLAADFDFHVGERLAAVDDGAIARRARQVALAAREAFFGDQLDVDAFARRHDGDRQRRFGKAVAGREGRSLEARVGEGVDEVLHHVGPDHVRAVSGEPPARQVEAFGDARLARDAARADVVTEGPRIGERGALVAADEIEPGERTA